MELMIPIYNFNFGNNKSVKLHNALIVRETPKIIAFSRHERGYEILIPECRIIFDIDKIQNLRYFLRKTLTILKLFKEGSPFSNILFVERKIYDYLPHYDLWRNEKKYSFAKHLIIDKKELNRFKRFWEKYFDVDLYNYCLNKFCLADHEPNDHDMFMKYIECLEYLLVPDGYKGVISYKFASRGAQLLAQITRDNIEDIYSTLNSAYGLRSALSHGDKKRANNIVEKKSIIEYIKELRIYCRCLIRIFYENEILVKNSTNDKRTKFLKDTLVFRPNIKLPVKPIPLID